MSSLKIIKRRIASVDSTRQIVRALDLLSASKLQKAKTQLQASQQMFVEISRVIDEIKSSRKVAESVYISGRTIENSAIVVITSDSGLCGSYNLNISRAALSFINEDLNEKIVAVGLHGMAYFQSRNKTIIHGIANSSENALYEDAESIGRMLLSQYISGEIDEIYIAYTHFESSITHIPRIVKLLPIDSEPQDALWYDSMTYEPDINSFLEFIVPLYVNSYIHYAIMESAACEHMARITSMHSASKNADEILEKLTNEFNSKRQGIVTQEISEIVSGAKALGNRNQ
jgi:F-type H+-transporting ATPase subunit gamma